MNKQINYDKQIEVGNFCIQLLFNILASFLLSNLLQQTAMNQHKPNEQTYDPS